MPRTSKNPSPPPQNPPQPPLQPPPPPPHPQSPSPPQPKLSSSQPDQDHAEPVYGFRKMTGVADFQELNAKNPRTPTPRHHGSREVVGRWSSSGGACPSTGTAWPSSTRPIGGGGVAQLPVKTKNKTARGGVTCMFCRPLKHLAKVLNKQNDQNDSRNQPLQLFFLNWDNMHPLIRTLPRAGGVAPGCGALRCHRRERCA